MRENLELLQYILLPSCSNHGLWQFHTSHKVAIYSDEKVYIYVCLYVISNYNWILNDCSFIEEVNIYYGSNAIYKLL